jgi:TnpA family transposase
VRQNLKLSIYAGNHCDHRSSEFTTNSLEEPEIIMLLLHLLQISLVYINTLKFQQVLAGEE